MGILQTPINQTPETEQLTLCRANKQISVITNHAKKEAILCLNSYREQHKVILRIDQNNNSEQEEQSPKESINSKYTNNPHLFKGIKAILDKSKQDSEQIIASLNFFQLSLKAVPQLLIPIYQMMVSTLYSLFRIEKTLAHIENRINTLNQLEAVISKAIHTESTKTIEDNTQQLTFLNELKSLHNSLKLSISAKKKRV